MQFVEIKQNAKLSDIRDMVGTSNLESVLAINSLKRVPNIGKQVYERNNVAARQGESVSLEYKIQALGRASQDLDIFEEMALMGDSGWKVYQSTDALPGTLRIPDGIVLPKSVDVLGNGKRVPTTIYDRVMVSMYTPPHVVDSSEFDTYSGTGSTQIYSPSAISYENMFQFFKVPWGNMTIYSSIANTSMDFPVYPEEMSDGVRANYTTMPEIIYQYEPWQLFTSSGPRTNSYTFLFHRDMWTGNHMDGKANELVRFCMANCYPEYRGSAVNTALTSLYMNGDLLIRGVLTDVTANWDGPLGHDGYYLVCKLTLTFIEVSPYALDYWTMMQKPLIG